MKQTKRIFLLMAILSILISPVWSRSKRSKEIDSSALSKLSMPLLMRLDQGKPAQYIVAVFEDTGKADKASVDLSAVIGDILAKSGRVTTVARDSKMDGVMKEYELSMSGLTENSAEIGSLLGADIIVFGRIANVGEQTIDKTVYELKEIAVDVEVQGIEVSSGKVVFSFTGNGKTTSDKIFTSSEGDVVSGTVDYANLYLAASTEAVKKVAPSITKHFPLIGAVASAGKEIMITLSSVHGLKVGDEVTVIRKGDAVKNPSTGEILSFNNQVIGKGEVVEVQSGFSKVSVKRNNGTIAVGDIVVYNEEEE